MTKPTIFLDKDGTLIENLPYNVDPDRIRWSPGIFESLRALYAAGFQFVIITNQSGIARGYFCEDDLDRLAEAMANVLQMQAGVPLAGFYYCPHHPAGMIEKYALRCECRKPKPGMILQAASDLGIDLCQAWMVGDVLDDIEAGNTAGCRTILVDNGNETCWDLTGNRQPDFIVVVMREAANAILRGISVRKAHLSQC